MNVVGRLACLTCLLLAACGGSSSDDLESALKDDLQRQIAASGRQVQSVYCAHELPFCIARVRTSPLADGVKRDLAKMYETEVAEVACDRATYRCRAQTADGRRITVILALDDPDDYSIVTTAEE